MPTIDAVKIDGNKLKEFRLAKFWSRDELASESGIHRDHIGRLERGRAATRTLPRSGSWRRRWAWNLPSCWRR